MKISVITAVYNNHETISDALCSVLSQSHESIETIVLDGGSTDGTISVIEKFSSRIDVFQSEPDNGIYDALNKGILLSSGEVVGYMHSDDLFANDHVLSLIADTFEDSSVDAVYGDLVYVNKEAQGRVIRHWRAGDFSTDKLARGWMPPHPTFYMRKSLYNELGGFDTSYRIAADYDFMLRVLTRSGLHVKYIPEVLVKMRIGGASNRSFKNIIQKSCEDYRALRKNHVGGFYGLILKNLSKLPQFFRHD